MAELLYAEQLAEVTTSATSAQVAKTTSPTVATAAKFFCLFTYEVNLNVAGTDYVTVEGFVDGVSIGEHRYIAETTADWHPGTFQAAQTLGAGARTLELRFHVNNGARTAKVRNVRLLAWSAAIAGSFDSPAATGYSAPDENVVKIGEVVLPPTPAGGTFIAFWAASLSSDSTLRRPRLNSYIYQGATPVGFAGSAELDVKSAGLYAPAAGFRLFGVAPSAQPLAVTLGLSCSSGGGVAVARDVSIVVFQVTGSTDFTVAGFQEVSAPPPLATASLTAIATTTFTAVATWYLMFGTANLRASSATADIQYDLRHDASARQGPGLIEAGHTSQRLSFTAFDYATYAAGSVTDALRAARSGSTGTITAADATILTLKVGLQANPVDPLTLQHQLEVALEKILDAETLTFSEGVEFIRAISDALTTETLTLEHVVEFLMQREAADTANLADGALAILLPRTRQTRAIYRPVQLVEILFPGGARYYATRDIYATHPQGLFPANTFFLGIQMSFVEPSEFGVDEALGFQPIEALSLVFGNLRGEFTFLRYVEARRARVRVWEYDVANDEWVRIYLGYVNARPAIGKQATFETSMQSLDLLQRELPLRAINAEDFRHAPAESLGQPVTLCWGNAYKLPLRLIHYELYETPVSGRAGRWVYLAYEKALAEPGLGWPTPVSNPRVTNIYRDGRLVDPSEYQVQYTTGDYSAQYVTVEFFRDQGDRWLCFDAAQEEPVWRNPATIAQGLLALYGREPVNAASFEQAAATLNAQYAGSGTLPAFDFSLAEPMKMVDVLNEILFRLRLGRDDQGAWTATVDTLATTAALRLGMGVGTEQNAEIGPLVGRTIEEMPATVELLYGYTRGVRGDNARFVFSRNLPAAPIPDGQTVQREMHFLWDHFTADAWIQYNTASIVLGEESCTAVVGREARGLRRGMVVLVNVPAPSHGIVNELFRVARITYGVAQRTLTLERHGPGLYAFARNTNGDPSLLPPDPTTPDYTFTPPPKPASLTIEAWYGQRANGPGGDGRLVASVMLRALLPASPKNGTSVIFKWRLSAEPLLLHPGDETLIGTTHWGTGIGVPGTIGNLTPGLTYDFIAYLFNANNDRGTSLEEDAQNGEVITLPNVRVPEALTVPVSIVGWTVVASGAVGGIYVRAVVPPSGSSGASGGTAGSAGGAGYPSEIGGVRYYRRQDQQAPTEADFVAQTMAGYLDLAVGQNPSVAWYYWAKLVDKAGQVTPEFTPRSSAAFVRQLSPTESGPGAQSLSATGEHLHEFEALAAGSWVAFGELQAPTPTSTIQGTTDDSASSGPAGVMTYDVRVDVRFRGQITGSPPLAADTIEARLVDGAGAVLHGPITVMKGFTASTGELLLQIATVLLSRRGALTIGLELRATTAGATTFAAGDTGITLTSIWQGVGLEQPT